MALYSLQGAHEAAAAVTMRQRTANPRMLAMTSPERSISLSSDEFLFRRLAYVIQPKTLVVRSVLQAGR